MPLPKQHPSEIQLAENHHLLCHVWDPLRHQLDYNEQDQLCIIELNPSTNLDLSLTKECVIYHFNAVLQHCQKLLTGLKLSTPQERTLQSVEAGYSLSSALIEILSEAKSALGKFKIQDAELKVVAESLESMTQHLVDYRSNLIALPQINIPRFITLGKATFNSMPVDLHAFFTQAELESPIAQPDFMSGEISIFLSSEIGALPGVLHLRRCWRFEEAEAPTWLWETGYLHQHFTLNREIKLKQPWLAMQILPSAKADRATTELFREIAAEIALHNGFTGLVHNSLLSEESYELERGFRKTRMQETANFDWPREFVLPFNSQSTWLDALKQQLTSTPKMSANHKQWPTFKGLSHSDQGEMAYHYEPIRSFSPLYLTQAGKIGRNSLLDLDQSGKRWIPKLPGL